MTTKTRDNRVLQLDRSHVHEAGALVIGGDYRGLGIVRSLGRKGIPVWVLQDDRNIATFSRYCLRSVPWPDSTPERQIDYLLALGQRHELNGWMLFPTTDKVAALLSQHRDRLLSTYHVTTPSWHVVDWAFDKRLTHEFAQSVGLDTPRTHYPSTRKDVESLSCEFPVILKPATRDGEDSFTRDKAWQVNDRQSLIERYDEACGLVDEGIVMVQELIPGGGNTQLSYAALCEEGRPLAAVVAQRTRQYPTDFGRFSTFVETVHRPDVEGLSRRLIAASRYTGLVEIEFKYDRRDQRLKLLDVNPRVWGWHTLGWQVGLDFPYLLWLLVRDEPIPDFMPPAAGAKWSYFLPDTLSAVSQMKSRTLSVMSYLRSLRGRRESAIFATDDPRPYFAGGPALLRRHYFRNRSRPELPAAGFAAGQTSLEM